MDLDVEVSRMLGEGCPNAGESPPARERCEYHRLLDELHAAESAALAKTLETIEAYPGMDPVSELVAIERVAREALGESP